MNYYYILFYILLYLTYNKELPNPYNFTKEQLEEYNNKIPNLMIGTKENFTQIIKSNNFVLLFFHSPRSDSCHKLIDDMIKYTKILSELDDPLYIISINNDDKDNNAGLLKNFKIEKIPTFIIYNSINNRYKLYPNEKVINKVLTFFIKNSGELLLNLDTKKYLIDKVFLDKKVSFESVILFNKEYENNFLNISKYIPFSLVGKCYEENCQKRFNYNKNEYDYIMIKSFKDYSSNEYDKFKFLNETNEYYNILKNSINTIDYPSDFQRQIIFSARLDTINYIKKINENLSDNEIKEMLQKIIDDKSNNITFGIIFDPNNATNKEILEISGFELEEYKDNGLIYIYNFVHGVKGSKIYQMNNKEINLNSIKQFLLDFKDKKIKPNIFSESTKKDIKPNFKIIVGKNFEKIVLNNNEQAVFMVFAPIGCKNCDMMNYVLTEMSKRNKDNKEIIFCVGNPFLNVFKDFDVKMYKGKAYVRYYFKDKSRGYEDFNYKFLILEDTMKWIKDKNDTLFYTGHENENNENVNTTNEKNIKENVDKTHEKNIKNENSNKNEQKKETDL